MGCFSDPPGFAVAAAVRGFWKESGCWKSGLQTDLHQLRGHMGREARHSPQRDIREQSGRCNPATTPRSAAVCSTG
jgi:hypothetical protein